MREKGLRDYVSGIETAREEGLELGIERKTRETALNMKADGLPNNIIAKYLGISESDVEAILKS